MTTRSRYDPERHRRQSTRRPGWDYAGPGRYFVTVCSFNHETIFGDVVDGEAVLSDVGKVVEQTWIDIAELHAFVRLDAFIVMPNHLHGIIEIIPSPDRGLEEVSDRLHGAKPHSLGAIIAGFKGAATKRGNLLPDTGTATLWQRGYHDRVIPDDETLDRARRYILANPARWPHDPEHPANKDRPRTPTR